MTLLSGFTPTLHGSKEDKELLGGFILMLLACRYGLPFALAAGCWFRRSFVRAVLAGALVGVAMELLLFLLSEPEFSPFRMILRDLLIAFPLCAIPCALGAGIVPLLYAACSAIRRPLWHRKKSGAFVQDEISFADGRWLLTLGSKFEHNEQTGLYSDRKSVV